MIRRLLRLLRPAPKAPPRQPVDPRVAADPWLATLFAQLGDRYRLGTDGPDGAQVLRRTARTRFNPMQVWLRPGERAVLGDYQVRASAGRTKRGRSSTCASPRRCTIWGSNPRGRCSRNGAARC